MAPPEEAEDFSFPPITDTPPRFFHSPPLWRPSSSSSSDDHDHDHRAAKGDHEGERMDVLWEDLNEEIHTSGSLVSNLAISSGLNAKCGCLQKFNPSKGHGKRPNVLVFVKLLQKLLSVRRPIKKRAL